VVCFAPHAAFPINLGLRRLAELVDY